MPRLHTGVCRTKGWTGTRRTRSTKTRISWTCRSGPNALLLGILALSSVLATVSRGRGHVLPVRWVLFGFVFSRVMQDRTVSRWPRDSGARMRNSCKVARTSVFVPVFQRKVPNPPQCQDAQVQGDRGQVNSWRRRGSLCGSPPRTRSQTCLCATLKMHENSTFAFSFFRASTSRRFAQQ